MKFFNLLLILFILCQCKKTNTEQYTINDLEYIYDSGAFDSYDSKTKIFRRQYFDRMEETFVPLNDNVKKEILEIFLANEKELINFNSGENLCNDNYSEPAIYDNFYLIIKQNKYRFEIYYENENCIKSPAYKILQVIKNNLYKNNTIKNLEETNMYLE